MPKIRVLVVDDAVVFRRLLADELSRDPALDVVGTAAERPHRPGQDDPGKSGPGHPRRRDAGDGRPGHAGRAAKDLSAAAGDHVQRLDGARGRGNPRALALGATDYFTKPTNLGGLEASLQVIREQLIPKIKALCAGTHGAAQAPRPRPCRRLVRVHQPAAAPAPRESAGPIEVVAIGTSTGGPNALADIFRRLPADFPVPIVIVQHMPPMFTRLLAERLSAQYPIPVQEASPGDVLQPGHAWIAPGDYHMIVVRDGLQVPAAGCIRIRRKTPAGRRLTCSSARWPRRSARVPWP